MPQKTTRIPLLKDRHSHPLFYSSFGQAVSLQAVESKEEANKILKRAAADTSTELLVAQGWRSNYYSWSEEEIETFPPLAIFNVSLHSLLINRAGKQILSEKYGGLVDQLGNQTWYENNLRVVLNWFAKLHASVESLQDFYDQMLTQGVYHIEEMLLVDETEIALFEQADLLDRTNFWAAPDTYEMLSDNSKQRIDGLKLFTDGAIGSCTAAMQRPYLNSPSSEPNHGMLVYSDDQIGKTVARCLDTGKSLAIHAIGDKAIEQVISTFEKSGPGIRSVPNVRIEHVQMISADLAKRAKRLGVVLCMQPNFSSDSIDYSDRLDAKYCAMNNPFRMLIDQAGFVAGEDLIFGSDGMPHGFEAAARQAFFPDLQTQKLSEAEFVAGYCLEDETRGTIELETGNNQLHNWHVDSRLPTP